MGGKFYKFVRRATDDENESYNCLSPCIYETEGKLFCFRRGNLISESIKTNAAKSRSILITGGLRGGTIENALSSTEIFHPDSNTTCSLPDLPKGRAFHTQDGGFACGGGWGITNTCDKWTNGSWIRSNISIGSRMGHVSWVTTFGIYFMGGLGYEKTSDILKDDGSVEKGFNLKYFTE